MKYLLIFIVIFTLSCKSHNKGTVPHSKTETVSEELTLILSDNYGGTQHQEIQIIRTGGELKSFFADINKTRKPRLAVPKIDFSKEMAVIFCSGKTTNSEIPGLFMVSESDDRLTLGIKRQNTITDSTSTAMLMPFGLYTMSLTDKEVVLDKLN